MPDRQRSAAAATATLLLPGETPAAEARPVRQPDRKGGRGPRQRWFLGSPLRRLRLATGLVLFSYVLTHLLNHATLNIDVRTADAVLRVQKAIWRSLPGTAALYGALLVHAALGLHALYARRSLRWRSPELCQLVLGLAIPAMLANHALVTRAAWSLQGLDKAYGAELDALWVAGADPAKQFWGWLQIALLLGAWAHGCIGLTYLLRLRRFYPRVQPLLLVAAVLIPVLALLGFASGGREVVRALASAAPAPQRAGGPAAPLPAAGRVAMAAPAGAGVTIQGKATPAQARQLADLRNAVLGVYAALLGAIFLARGIRALRERRLGRIALHYPGGRKIGVPKHLSILEASRWHGIAHASICGGKGRCSTCRVRILWSAGPLPPPAPHERAVLQAIGADPLAIRLACQLRPTGDLAIAPLIPPEIAGAFALGRAPRIPGDERFLAVMFIDLRGSSRLAERRMPFDSVFLLGRFIALATRATVETGGRPVQFLGDGLLSLFGLETDPATACRQALAALAALQAGLAELKPLFGQETGEALRYGIGLHCGRAVIGEIGFGGHVAFTALGDTVNLAHRLQEYARDMDAVAAVSSDVYLTAAQRPPEEEHSVVLRGRSAPIALRLLRGSAEAPVPEAAPA